MRRELVWITLWLLVVPGILFAQTTGNITGKVVDETGAALDKALIRIKGTDRGGYSGTDGTFRIVGVGAGQIEVQFSYGGRESVTRTTSVTINQTTDLGTVKLSKKNGRAITVVAQARHADVPGSVDTKTGDQINRSSRTGNVFQTAVLSTGVSSVGQQNDRGFRGGRVEDGSIRVDGLADSVNLSSLGLDSTVATLIIENEFLSAWKENISTFSIDVDAASYSLTRRSINAGYLPPRDAVRIEEMINYFHYDYSDPPSTIPFSIRTEISECPWNSSHRLVHIGLQGRHIDMKDLPPSNLVFLIDVSGSMASDDRLPLLKKAFRLLVNELREQDRVSIVVYAGAAGLVLSPTSGGNKREILDAIDRLGAGGSTAGGAGINLAYQIAKDNFIAGGNNRVILATDGDFNVGVSSERELVELIESKREGGVFLTVLGFGSGNYQDTKMEQLADKGNGNYAYVDGIEEAKKVFVGELGATLHTIAKDVKIQVEFNPSLVASYRLIGYENRRLENRDFHDDRKDAGELGAGHSATALYEVELRSATTHPPRSGPDLGSLASGPMRLQPASLSGDTVMYVKLRYKEPAADTSSLLIGPVIDRNDPIESASDDFRFSAAVAEFGLLLRDSRFKGTASYDAVLQRARESQGSDGEGYRAEFISLVEKSRSMTREGK